MAIITITVIGLILWLVLRERKSRQQQRELERIKTEQNRQRAEQAEQRQQRNEEIRQRIEQQRELLRLAKEQERQAKEQEKQAAQLAKHEKRLADLEFRMEQAESDIEFLNDRIAQLDAQRDYLLLQQSGTVPGGKEHTKYQTKIISIENQIHTAESKMAKAQYIKTSAAKELAA